MINFRKYVPILLGTLSILAMAKPVVAQQFDNNHEKFIGGVRGKTVGVLFTDTNTDLTIIWSKIIKRDFDRLGIKMELRDANWNPETQIQALEAFLADEKKPDLLIIQNFNLTALVPGIKKAQEAGVKVIQLNMPSRQLTDAYIGVDYVEVGEEIANQIVKACAPAGGKSGKVAIIQGDITGGDSLLQMIGVKKVFQEHPEIQVVSTQGTDWDPTKAHDVTATVLQQHPDLCAAYGLWDGHTVGIAEAVKEAGLQGKVLVYTNGAGHRKACDSVSNGLFDAYWSYNSLRQASDVVSVATMLLQSEDPAGSHPRSVFTPLEVITRDNLQPQMCFDTN